MSYPKVNLFDICRPKQWKTISSTDLLDSGYAVYGANGKIGFYSEYTHKNPTLMITCRGATCGNVHISEPMSYINGNAMALDELNESQAYIKYLYYYFKNRGFDDVISGSAQPQITGQGLTKIKIPIPPLAEQKRIAAILDKADAIRRKRQQAIQLAEEFLRSVFLDMFGDPVTNPKGWETQKLGELARIRRGASPRPISDFLGGDVPWIKIGDATKGENIYITSTAEYVTQAGADKSVYLREGALIFANCGVSLGFARILKIAGCIHDGWLAIEDLNQNISQMFLLKWINQLTQHFRKIAPEGTQPNLNTGIMKDQDVILPPLELQKTYEQILLQHDGFIEKLNLAYVHSENYFNSLSQKAFSGQL